MKKIKPFKSDPDTNPQYTVKEAADLVGLSPHAVRYYDKAGLIPDLDRSYTNARLFSEQSLNWLKMIHCLRMTGLSIEGIRKYIEMCLEGDSTIPQRAQIIFEQEKVLRDMMRDLKSQLDVLIYKKKWYQDLLDEKCKDDCNPATKSPKSDSEDLT